MVKFNVDGAQNVEVSVKLPCEKSLEEQLRVMERYTSTHQANLNQPKEIREVECLKVLYPYMFRSIEPQDRIAGRIDFLPIGFGTVTSLGGVGHYCVFNKLRDFQKQLTDENDKERVDRLYEYWLNHDLKTRYCREVLTEDTIGRFIDCDAPLIATARLSGMMLDYPKLLERGIGGLRKELEQKLVVAPHNMFYKGALGCLDIFSDSADYLSHMAKEMMAACENEGRRKELKTISEGLDKIKSEKPETFHEALQLLWLYALLAGVINYGRLDVFHKRILYGHIPYRKRLPDSGGLIYPFHTRRY